MGAEYIGNLLPVFQHLPEDFFRETVAVGRLESHCRCYPVDEVSSFREQVETMSGRDSVQGILLDRSGCDLLHLVHPFDYPYTARTECLGGIGRKG